MSTSKSSTTTADVGSPAEILPPNQPITPQMFFDGYSHLLVSAANTKITFHQLVSITDKGAEQRKMALTAVLPTAALVEMCQAILENIKLNESGLLTAMEDQNKKLADLLRPR